MKRKTILGGALGVIFLASLYYFNRGGEAPQGQPPVRNLTAANVGDLEHEFNAAKDQVRVLLLLSPT